MMIFLRLLTIALPPLVMKIILKMKKMMMTLPPLVLKIMFKIILWRKRAVGTKNFLF